MDKNWTREPNTLSGSFIKGVESFINFAKDNVEAPDNLIKCPCGFCNNTRWYSFEIVKKHLHMYGFSYTYTEWIFNGEKKETSGDGDNDIEENMNPMFELNDGLDDMLDDMAEVQQEDGETESFVKLCRTATREIYPGCDKSLLTVVVKLFHIKVQNLWSNKSFEMLLMLLKEILPTGHTLLASYYSAKKIFDEMGMGYEDIEVCKYDCALSYKENEDKVKCPVCQEPKWKFDDKTPRKLLRHFSLKPRLQKMFMSGQIASDMRWT